MLKTYKISFSGQVQGVGFRPYVFNLARRFNLTGTVSNNEEGVIIYVTGKDSCIWDFYKNLSFFPPPVSHVENHKLKEIDFLQFDDFKIIPSSVRGNINLRLTPDFAICNQCMEDINNPINRRHNYAFTTCVNCGPRWAITKKFPFEREHTSIVTYPMCKDCQTEYADPSNRRFHSQTNTCNTCGIILDLCDNQNNLILNNQDELFTKVASLLAVGNIVAIKNTSGYLLCCSAEDSGAIKRLRVLKKRPTKPFAVLYPSIEKLRIELDISDEEIKILKSSERPITILSSKNFKGKLALEEVAPGLKQLGVMLPYTGILQLLGQCLTFPIVATSGNIHGSPIISNKDEAMEKLGAVADYFIHHDLLIEHPQDDSVLKFSYKNKIPVLFRRSRGYAPNVFVAHPKQDQKILAMGADLKSSVGFFPNQHIYVSQYLGNLENYDVYKRFIRETKSFLEIFECDPEVVLTDKHPKYLSTSFGKELSFEMKVENVSIQHHKSHFASVLGEHDLLQTSEKILGVVWDGVGYGDDGQVWGGEFFDYSSSEINRVGHFEYFDWLAGDKMSKEPRLSLFSLCEEEAILSKKFSEEEQAIYKVIKKKNKIKTSSVGRLFDAVASLLNICDYNSFEGEASILLENLIDSYHISKCKSYSPKIFSNFIPTRHIVSQIMNDLKNKIPNKVIATNFIFTLADIIIQFAINNDFKTICCSGGVFQNTTLVDMLTDLNDSKLKIYFNEKLPPNDENISFGQIMYYLNCVKL